MIAVRTNKSKPVVQYWTGFFCVLLSKLNFFNCKTCRVGEKGWRKCLPFWLIRARSFGLFIIMISISQTCFLSSQGLLEHVKADRLHKVSNVWSAYMIDQSYRMKIELWMGFRVFTIQSSFLALIDHVCRYLSTLCRWWAPNCKKTGYKPLWTLDNKYPNCKELGVAYMKQKCKSLHMYTHTHTSSWVVLLHFVSSRGGALHGCTCLHPDHWPLATSWSTHIHHCHCLVVSECLLLWFTLCFTLG